MHFEYLRPIPWHPTFSWLRTSIDAADQINSFHLDYPERVCSTIFALEKVEVENVITNSQLRVIHRFIFSDQPFAGKWRDVDVTVGRHRPPVAEAVDGLMLKLESIHTIMDVKTLTEWYWNFETIHPFQDGNGRVGGVIVAAYSHSLHPDRGWLTVEQ